MLDGEKFVDILFDWIFPKTIYFEQFFEKWCLK